MMDEALSERFKNACKCGRTFVGTIEQAELRIAEAKGPLVIQFASLSVGLEDKQPLDALAESVIDRDIFILYDEADMLQTKAMRAKSTAQLMSSRSKKNL